MNRSVMKKQARGYTEWLESQRSMTETEKAIDKIVAVAREWEEMKQGDR